MQWAYMMIMCPISIFIKHQTIKDKHLVCVIVCLVVVDVTILGLYMLVEGFRGHLRAVLEYSREDSEDIVGVRQTDKGQVYRIATRTCM